MTMQLIETKTLGTAAASIEFTSIPQDATDLLALVSCRGDTSAVFINLVVRVNGLGSGYTERILAGDGSSPSTLSSTEFRFLVYANASSATSNTFSNASLYLPNYTGSTAKSFSADSVTENNATTALSNISAGLSSGTAAVTTLSFTAYAGNLISGSTISLYKITKGTDGTTVVS